MPTGRVDTCPKCESSELTDSTQRRQRWLDGYDRKRDAVAALAAITTEADRVGGLVQPSRQKLGTYLKQTWLPGIKSGLKPTTYLSYKSAVEAHIAPRLGHHPLRELAPHHINAFFADLLELKLSPTTVRYYGTILSRSLRQAVAWQLLARNICEQANPPRPAHPEMKVWDAGQLKNFLNHVAEERLFPVYLVAAMTGLRRSELLGLRWSDLNLDAGTLRVNQTLVVLGYKPQFGTPKTKASIRTISLDPGTVDVLRKWRKRQIEEQLRWGAANTDSALIFTAEGGDFLPPCRSPLRSSVTPRPPGFRC